MEIEQWLKEQEEIKVSDNLIISLGNNFGKTSLNKVCNSHDKLVKVAQRLLSELLYHQHTGGPCTWCKAIADCERMINEESK